MEVWLSIAAGGALGAVLRYATVQMVQQLLGRSFPYGTLTVNVLGSFLLGVLVVYFAQRGLLSSYWARGLMVGVLGAFTTFSTFSFETYELLQHGAWLKGFLNISLNVSLCVFAIGLGMFTARSF